MKRDECLFKERNYGKIDSSLSRKKPAESFYAIRNVSFIHDAKTCKYKELSIREGLPKQLKAKIYG